MSTDNGADDPASTPDGLENLIADLLENGAEPESCEAAIWQEGVAHRHWDVARRLSDEASYP